MKTVVIFGAGASRAEALNNQVKIAEDNLPPLDSTIFQQANKLKVNYLDPVTKSILEQYGYNILEEQFSFEYIYNLVYSDAINEEQSIDKVRKVWRFLNIIFKDVIRITTNDLACSNPQGIFGILNLIIKDYPKSELDIITFNYDLIVEKALSLIQATNNLEDFFEIRNCYPHINFIDFLISPIMGELFPKSDSKKSIKLYKLHGSINWFNRTDAPSDFDNFLHSKILYTFLMTDKRIDREFSYRDKESNKFYVLKPMIVPPLYDKNRFYSELLKPSWDAAQAKLSQADRIIVFGYSLPEADMKAHTMLLSALSQNKKKYSFEIIDTNPQICQRYIEKLPIGSLKYYKSVAEFVKQNK